MEEEGEEEEQTYEEGHIDTLEDEDYNSQEAVQLEEINDELETTEIDEVWTEDLIFALIQARGSREGDMKTLGTDKVMAAVLEDLGVEGITNRDVQEKWKQVKLINQCILLILL